MDNIVDNHVSIHHIGGRLGTQGFPIPKSFERDTVNVIYEADIDCIEQIKEYHKHSNTDLHILPYCIGDSEKKAIFYINKDRFTSSLYKFNPEYKDSYVFYFNHDYILSESICVEEQRDLELINLDKLYSDTKLSIPPPDFLSLDVQGAEYDILSGADHLLDSNILGLIIEVEFHPIYQNQKLFSDIYQYLDSKGFHFVKFMKMHEDLSPYRYAIGMRGDGFNVAADALFLRKIDNVKTILFSNSNSDLLYSKLSKLSYMSLILKQYEYGFECLNVRNSIFEDRSYNNDINYLNFLNDLSMSTKINRNKYFPQTFSERCENKSDKIHPNIINSIFFKYIISYMTFFKKIYTVLFVNILPVVGFVFFKRTPIEKIFCKYKLLSQAIYMKRKRITHRFFARKNVKLRIGEK